MKHVKGRPEDDGVHQQVAVCTVYFPNEAFYNEPETDNADMQPFNDKNIRSDVQLLHFIYILKPKWKCLLLCTCIKLIFRMFLYANV